MFSWLMDKFTLESVTTELHSVVVYHYHKYFPCVLAKNSLLKKYYFLPLSPKNTCYTVVHTYMEKHVYSTLARKRKDIAIRKKRKRTKPHPLH